MPLSICFWVLMLIWFAWGEWEAGSNWKAHWPNVLLFLLLAVLGWQVFGPAIHR